MGWESLPRGSASFGPHQEGGPLQLDLRTLAYAATTTVIATLASVAVGEMCIRVLAPQNTYGGGTAFLADDMFDLPPSFSGSFSHPDYRYRLNTDEKRMRRTHAPAKTPRGTVLVLGDSFAFGMGVDDDKTLASRISQRLEKAGCPAKVTNAGVPAYTLAESACKLQRADVDPDVVIVVAAFNDAVANLGECHALLNPQRRSAGARASFWRRAYPVIRDFALGHSHLAVFVAYRMNQLLVRTKIRDSFSGVLGAYAHESYVREKPRVDNVETVLRRIRRHAEARGSRSVFVYIPGFLEVSDELWEATTKGRNGFDRGLPRRTLLGAAKRAGFPAIVDGATLFSRGGSASMYFPLDMHLNERGLDALAELVTPKCKILQH